MQLWALGDAELICCYRRWERWGVCVPALAQLQTFTSNIHACALFKATQLVCTSLNRKVWEASKLIPLQMLSGNKNVSTCTQGQTPNGCNSKPVSHQLMDINQKWASTSCLPSIQWLGAWGATALEDVCRAQWWTAWWFHRSVSFPFCPFIFSSTISSANELHDGFQLHQ